MGKLFEDWKIKEFVFLGISLIAIIFCFVFQVFENKKNHNLLIKANMIWFIRQK